MFTNNPYCSRDTWHLSTLSPSLIRHPRNRLSERRQVGAVTRPRNSTAPQRAASGARTTVSDFTWRPATRRPKILPPTNAKQYADPLSAARPALRFIIEGSAPSVLWFYGLIFVTFGWRGCTCFGEGLFICGIVMGCMNVDGFQKRKNVV